MYLFYYLHVSEGMRIRSRKVIHGHCGAVDFQLDIELSECLVTLDSLLLCAVFLKRVSTVYLIHINM